MFTIKVYQRPKKKASWEAVRERVRRLAFSPYLGYGLVGAFVLADLALFTLLILPLSRERATRQAKVRALQTTLSQAKQQGERLRSQVAFFSRCNGEGVLWSEKLEALPRLLPASLWLEDVRVEKEPPGAKPAAGARRGGGTSLGAGPPLVIRGFSAADPGSNHIDLIGGFARALNEDPSFSGDFEAIWLESIQTFQGKGEATGFLLQSRPRLKK